MPEEKVSNLEPIEEGDLDLESKFKNVGETGTDMSSSHEISDKAVEGGSGAEKVLEAVSERSPAEKDSAYNKILSSVKSDDNILPPNDEELETDAKEAIDISDAEGRIQKLVDLAMQKGVVHSVKVARKMDDYYLLDMLHDRLLADDLHQALLEKGLIKGE